jgi:hypothetical protein
MQEINPDRQESPSRGGDGDEIMKANNDEVSAVVHNLVVSF